MIKFVDKIGGELSDAFLEGAELEPVSGARLQTLYEMFKEKYKNVEFWVQLDYLGKPSGAISRYGGQLCITHGTNADLDELEEFVRFIGGYSFITLSPSLAVMLEDLGETVSHYKMTREDSQSFPWDDFDLIIKPSLSDAYELLCAVDPVFKEQSDRAAWHVHASHLVRHKLGYCFGILREDGALISTGGMYSSGKTYGVIGGLATLPEEQRKGYGGTICRYLTNKIIAEGKIPALYAATESLKLYYESMGFAVKGRGCEIAVRDMMPDRWEKTS